MSSIAKAARTGMSNQLASRLENLHGSRSQAWDVKDIARAVLECHPRSADIMLAFLKEVASNYTRPGYFYCEMVSFSRGPARKTKMMIVLESAGFKRPHGMNTPPGRYALLLEKIGELRSSFHGQLQLFEMEPDDTSLISRPWWKTFFDMNTSRFPGDQSVWQRWGLPIIPEAKDIGLVEFGAMLMAGSVICMIIATAFM